MCIKIMWGLSLVDLAVASAVSKYDKLPLKSQWILRYKISQFFFSCKVSCKNNGMYGSQYLNISLYQLYIISIMVLSSNAKFFFVRVGWRWHASSKLAQTAISVLFYGLFSLNSFSVPSCLNHYEQGNAWANAVGAHCEFCSLIMFCSNGFNVKQRRAELASSQVAKAAKYISLALSC